MSNLIGNPAFAADASGWSVGFGSAPERVTSVPWGAVPAGATACAKTPDSNGDCQSDAVTVGAAESLDWSITFGAHGTDATHCEAAVYAVFYNAVGAMVAGTALVPYTYPSSWAADAWHTAGGTVAVPSGAATVAMNVQIDSDAPADAGDGYWTLCFLGEEDYGANVLINGGASMVFGRDVTLTLNPGSVAATEMAIRNDEDAYGAWEAFAATKAWTLSAACKVWAKFRDSA